jgi:uncharacterized delta-60 repeat protein
MSWGAKGAKCLSVAAAALVLAALLAVAAAGAGQRAAKVRLADELGRPSELVSYGRSKLLLFDSFEGPALSRVNDDGSLDSSFGEGGHLDRNGGGVAVAPDGRILVAGFGSPPGEPGNSDAAVTRLLPDGRPDPSFGNGGTALIDFGGRYDGAGTVAVAANGDILVGGDEQTIAESRGLSDATPAVGRLLPNGAVDRSFGNDGKRVLQGGFESGVLDIAPLRGGGLVAEGEGYLGIAVWKLTSSGQMNANFGKHGALNLEGGRGKKERYGWEEELSWVDRVGVLPSGKLLLAATGSRYDGRDTRYRALALRLRADGRIDRSFGHRGWAAATFGGTTFAHALTMLPHGVLVLACDAQFHHDRESDVGAVAFGPTGKIYRRFGNRGKVRVNLHRWDLVEDATTQGNRVVVLGQDREGGRWLVGVPGL